MSADEGATIEFGLVELSEEQIGRIPLLYRALLTAVSYANNEILCLTRLLLLTINSSKGERKAGALRTLVSINMAVINRILSSKVVEFLALVADFEGKNRLQNDELSKKIRSEILVELKALRKHRAYRLAKRVRNGVSHHYSMSDFMRYSDVAGFGTTGMWLADSEGNSVYQIGEDIVNFGLFAESTDAKVEIEEWVDWTREASRLISKANSDLAIAIAETFMPEISMKMHTEAVCSELLAEIDATKMPMLWHPFRALDR